MPNQNLKMVQVFLLDLDAMNVPLPGNLIVLLVLDQKVTAANTMIIRTDINLPFSTLLEKTLLERLLPDTENHHDLLPTPNAETFHALTPPVTRVVCCNFPRLREWRCQNRPCPSR